ncbi:HAD family hydrolase [Cyanobacterium aponinum]|uniref:Haloacid dehalogenase domain protein hydrolase n=1 Tax=Cyanobacterium aponinum (strain PCC 10605) TaxID=755178 RepID=K9ZA08_CYAAP|nr:HAD hydrolase-like protein [Cyanobacterium aponinum]AFZ55557.1 Haloacid dehalogenase domain protein hydrolase [Cyanobacterium aponinum PCC 10605]
MSLDSILDKTFKFDFDQTLIDSRQAEIYRKNREWSKVYDLIPQLLPYNGINELLYNLKSNNLKIGIVTSSPKNYCLKVINYWGWQIDSIVAYHDTVYHKPHPESLYKAIQQLSGEANSVIYVGVQEDDIIASSQAGILSVYATWGLTKVNQNINADYIFTQVSQLSQFILDLI